MFSSKTAITNKQMGRGSEMEDAEQKRARDSSFWDGHLATSISKTLSQHHMAIGSVVLNSVIAIVTMMKQMICQL